MQSLKYSTKLELVLFSCRKFVIPYLLTPWSRIFLEKLTVSQLVKKFLAFSWHLEFHYHLYRRSPPVSIPSHTKRVHASHPTSWRSIMMLSSHLRLGLPSGLFLSGFPTKTLFAPLLSPCLLHAPPISFFSVW